MATCLTAATVTFSATFTTSFTAVVAYWTVLLAAVETVATKLLALEVTALVAAEAAFVTPLVTDFTREEKPQFLEIPLGLPFPSGELKALSFMEKLTLGMVMLEGKLAVIVLTATVALLAKLPGSFNIFEPGRDTASKDNAKIGISIKFSNL